MAQQQWERGGGTREILIRGFTRYPATHRPVYYTVAQHQEQAAGSDRLLQLLGVSLRNNFHAQISFEKAKRSAHFDYLPKSVIWHHLSH